MEHSNLTPVPMTNAVTVNKKNSRSVNINAREIVYARDSAQNIFQTIPGRFRKQTSGVTFELMNQTRD